MGAIGSHLHFGPSPPDLPIQAVGLGHDDGKKLTDEYVRQQLSGIGIGDGGIGSRATLVVDHSAIGGCLGGGCSGT